MSVVGIGSQKTVGRVKDNQIKGHEEKREQNKSVKDKNRGKAKLKLSSTERFILVCNLYILYARF